MQKPDTENPDPGKLIIQVLKSIKKKLREAFRDSGIDLPFEQIRLLHVIEALNEPVQQDLSDHLHTDKSLILRQLVALEDDRYLVRVRDIMDARKKRVRLTEKGNDMVQKTVAIRRNVFEDILEGVSDQRREMFYGVLQDMLRNASNELNN